MKISLKEVEMCLKNKSCDDNFYIVCDCEDGVVDLEIDSIDEYDLIVDFLSFIEDDFMKMELNDILSGFDVVRNFSYFCNKYDLDGSFEKFRDSKYREFISKWAIDNNIELV